MFWGGYDRQRTLAIRIAAITLASDSAITIARFRPSKVAKNAQKRTKKTRKLTNVCTNTLLFAQTLALPLFIGTPGSLACTQLIAQRKAWERREERFKNRSN